MPWPVNYPDAQLSGLIYGDSQADIYDSEYPWVSQQACVSRAISNDTICDIVYQDWTSWTSNTSGLTMWGGRFGIGAEEGDSGSPVYSWNTGLGILANSSGRFARVQDIIDSGGWSMIK
jgi:hypothetical protein